jgi:hypothetical protein
MDAKSRLTIDHHGNTLAVTMELTSSAGNVMTFSTRLPNNPAESLGTLSRNILLDARARIDALLAPPAKD